MAGKVGTTDPIPPFSTDPVVRPAEPDGDDLAAPSSGVINPPRPAKAAGRHVCPYCGHLNDAAGSPCARCTMEDVPATRAATRARIGPWYVLQSRNPSAPGMKWSTLLALVAKGQVSAKSVVRGPTTHQFWRYAAQVKGLSREFGTCYSCGQDIEKSATQCPQCDRLQEPPANPDAFLETREPSPRVAPPSGPVMMEARTPRGSSSSAGSSAGSPEPVLNDLTIGKPRIVPPTPRPLSATGEPDGILSAKELAAAFQLDFNPAGPSSSGVLAAPRRKRSGGKVLFLLLLLAAGVAAGVVGYNPEYRAKAVDIYHRSADWANVQWQALKQPSAKPVVKPVKVPPTNTVSPAKVEPSSSSTVIELPAPPPQVETGKTEVEPKSSAKPAGDDKAAKTEIKTNMPPTVPMNTWTPPAPADPAPVEKPRVEPTPAAPSKPDVVAAPLDAGEALDRARKLYVQAMNFEANQDYVEAMKCYRQIKALPADNWPSDLDPRMERANEMLPK